VQDKLLQATGLTDRNRTYDPSRIKPQALGVLRPEYHDAATAACLAEVSFLDRADEELRLRNEVYRQKIAKSIADGIVAFTGPAVQAIPQPMSDLGDAIEIAAAATAGAPDVVAFLNLETVEIDSQKAPAAGTSDVNENSAKPSGLFSKAFVENVGPPLALIANAPQWPELGDFVAFIEKLKLQHFSADEFLFLGASNGSGKCKGTNSFPPKALWSNIKNTALMLDAIRKELGAPIRILSCYRAPAYNSCIGGEDQSLHMKFSAIDFTCAQGTPEIWRRVADDLRSKTKSFTGGIGIYPTARFVHIDTRGYIANWKGK
jgi:N-acetylmuramoyl-L-alanine amidase